MEVPGRCRRRYRCLASLLLLAWCLGSAAVPRRSIPHRQDRLGPPLDILLDSLNCTAFSVQWRMPKQHASTITGYTVFYSEVEDDKAVKQLSHDVPLSLDMLSMGQLEGQAIFSEMLGGFTCTVGERIRLADGSTVKPAPSWEELGCGGSWFGDLSMPWSNYPMKEVTRYLTKKQW